MRTAKSLPQPREDVTGMDLTGSMLLSLREPAAVHREALITVTRHLRDSCMVGNPAPVVRRIWQRISHPEPGDLAVANEVLHGCGDDDYHLKGFGVLLAIRDEWAETDADWAAFCDSERRAAEADGFTADMIVSDENRAEEHGVYYLQYGPEPVDVCRWVNSACTALPVHVPGFGKDAAAARDQDGAVFTRDSLIASLADSGFALRLPGAPPAAAAPRAATTADLAAALNLLIGYGWGDLLPDITSLTVTADEAAQLTGLHTEEDVGAWLAARIRQGKTWVPG